ncbi:uncharacterized protein V1513DRAFT_303725 [Lipomyces chichibuensis]|uniref:uncharacterized protein n=1 Tax=Lipomyces chichibuensis TaxID=1546026 RepID=UPI003342F25B
MGVKEIDACQNNGSTKTTTVPITVLEQRFGASQPTTVVAFLFSREWGSETIAHGWANCPLRSTMTLTGRRMKMKWNDRQRGRSYPSPLRSPWRRRLYPTAEEKKVLEKWMGRRVGHTTNVCEGVPRSKKALRARAIKKEATELLNKSWP